MNQEEIEKIRVSYEKETLDLKDLLDNPLEQTRHWFEKSVKLEIHEANAVSLATVGEKGQPSVRTVLIKGIDEQGLLFYTNYHSRKGREIEKNKHVAVLFFWKELERQVRIEGTIEKVSEEKSKSYFQSRPKGSQLGAWASPQSRVIVGREELEDRLKELDNIYKKHDQLPLPAHWGGYRIVPHYYEFWQGRPNRLHDRFEYKQVDNKWLISRLAP